MIENIKNNGFYNYIVATIQKKIKNRYYKMIFKNINEYLVIYKNKIDTKYKLQIITNNFKGVEK